ncbi:MAG TPA: putative peptidoglycan glycosyltransferase FtsW [Novosphingobium sp.]|nr:putative peptidoglycan glycosyltransferase FtsW [Novosphingobium sp.]
MASYPPLVPGRGKVGVDGRSLVVQRNRRSDFAIWWREIDRVLLGLVLALMAIGTVAVAAGSPASARRLSTASVRLDDLHFFYLHIRFQLLGLIAMFAASALPKDMARRAGIVLCFAMLAALLLVPLIGFSVNGARRWINLGMSLQPSEFLKPAFAIGMAWILSWRARDPNLPVIELVTGIMGMIAVLLMAQPDFGSAVLFIGVWFVMVLMSGISLKRIGLAGGAGLTFVALAYMFYDNARHRIDAFLGGGTAFDQVDLAQRTLLAGGWTGSGLWLGTRKLGLPEAHTDYIFSVIGEEFGLIACALIVILYLALVTRVLIRLLDEEDLFTTLAAAGLVAQIGGQAFINILVNLQLFPSKGMTLPLISYGGSSTIALCLGVGFLLSITRRNPFIKRERFKLSNVGIKL